MTPYPLILPSVSAENYIFFAILLIILFLSFRRKTDTKWFIPVESSQELRGLAIISIVCIHVWYELAKNWEFLHPISGFAGTGVDIFLLLSGYWLTISALRKPLPIIEFYKKRLFRVFLPFWVALIILYALDYFVLGIHYSAQSVAQSFLVFFPTADIWNDFNSPFWYLTWLLFFYIAFPIIFSQKKPILSAITMCIIWLIIVKINPFQMSTNWLHALHLFAFPLGMIFWAKSAEWEQIITKIISKKSYLLSTLSVLILFFVLVWNQDVKNFEHIFSFLGQIGDTSKILEQIKSIFLALTTIFIFILCPFKNIFLSKMGHYSYEIYLLHWPIIARYDVIFHNISAGIAVILTFILLVIIAHFFQKFVKILEKYILRKAP